MYQKKAGMKALSPHTHQTRTSWHIPVAYVFFGLEYRSYEGLHKISGFHKGEGMSLPAYLSHSLLSHRDVTSE
jgi:hypothetical protein